MYGSFTVTKNNGGVLELMGLSSDVDKLPSTLPNGSAAYCVDNGDIYILINGTWYKQ